MSGDTIVSASSIFGERRRYSRTRTQKSVQLHPVLREARLGLLEVSQEGFRGECSLSLALGQQVHVTLDGAMFVSAEVCWLNGQHYGFISEDRVAQREFPLVAPPGPQSRHGRTEPDPSPASDTTLKSSAMLVTCAPTLEGTIRNMSADGMMIEASDLAEGTRLLVKAPGSDLKMSRVQWSSGGMLGVFFERL